MRNIGLILLSLSFSASCALEYDSYEDSCQNGQCDESSGSSQVASDLNFVPILIDEKSNQWMADAYPESEGLGAKRRRLAALNTLLNEQKALAIGYNFSFGDSGEDLRGTRELAASFNSSNAPVFIQDAKSPLILDSGVSLQHSDFYANGVVVDTSGFRDGYMTLYSIANEEAEESLALATYRAALVEEAEILDLGCISSKIEHNDESVDVVMAFDYDQVAGLDDEALEKMGDSVAIRAAAEKRSRPIVGISAADILTGEVTLPPNSVVYVSDETLPIEADIGALAKVVADNRMPIAMTNTAIASRLALEECE